MIPLGYLFKNVAARPAGFNAESVADIYSLSNCISGAFADMTQFWKQNGYWLYDSPGIMEDLAAGEGIDLSEATLFYYEAHEYEFDGDDEQWKPFFPEPSFVTDVQIPLSKHLAGFDVITFSVQSGPECSPLSCNALALTLPVNEHCLFKTFGEASEALESGRFQDAEPGPYRIVAVYRVESR